MALFSGNSLGPTVPGSSNLDGCWQQEKIPNVNGSPDLIILSLIP